MTISSILCAFKTINLKVVLVVASALAFCWAVMYPLPLSSILAQAERRPSDLERGNFGYAHTVIRHGSEIEIQNHRGVTIWLDGCPAIRKGDALYYRPRPDGSPAFCTTAVCGKYLATFERVRRSEAKVSLDK